MTEAGREEEPLRLRQAEAAWEAVACELVSYLSAQPWEGEAVEGCGSGSGGGAEGRRAASEAGRGLVMKKRGLWWRGHVWLAGGGRKAEKGQQRTLLKRRQEGKEEKGKEGRKNIMK